jgi:nucleoside-diphosphate-sugar epimerase
MRVVVTGAAGFLGSHLAQLLVERGDEVVGIDNLVTGQRANLAPIEGDPRFRFVEHDVSEPFFVDGDVDGIVHMASPASPKDFPEIPIKILKVGGLGTYHCCGMAKAKGARLVIASTSEVYGDPLVHPQQEDYFGNVNTLGERGCYDEAKRFAEAMVMAYHRHHGVDVGIVRTFNTHGPRMRPDDGRVISNFCVQALSGRPLTVYGDGSQTRSLCYVDDQVRGYAAMLDATGVLGPVNIGTPGELTVLRIAELVRELTGSASPIVHLPAKPDDPARREPVIDRARDLLGWVPEIEAVEGLTRTIEWFRTELAGARG